jgi:RHS repeat-associated protein
VVYSEQFPSSYGPQGPIGSIPLDLLSYAQSLSWYSQAQDPTGLILLGERYYDPKSGRFLSPDPLGHPICLNLYAYANGDPINYFDLNGRFHSPVYLPTQPTRISSPQYTSLGNFIVSNVNTFSSYCADKNFTRSYSQEVGSFELANGAIGFMNGIKGSTPRFLECISKISRYGNGVKVHGIYNAGNTIPVDLIECLIGYAGVRTPPDTMLRNELIRFAETHGPDAKYLQICSSGAAIHVKNTLASLPRWIQQKVIVVSCGGATIIPKEICFDSFNYASKRDFIPYIDVFGNYFNGNQLQKLEPHSDAGWLDHEFLSPTFQGLIERHVIDHVKIYGGKK